MGLAVIVLQAPKDRLTVSPARRQDAGDVIDLIGRVFREYGWMFVPAVAWCRENAITHLVLWSDTRFDQAHRLYLRMGFAQTGERTLPEHINQTREFRFERAV